MILGLFGNVGKFKTALATLIAYILLKSGIPVYTNYNMNFEGLNHLIHKLSLSSLLELDVDVGAILVDEVYTVAEARVSSSKVNRFFSYFIFQSRKLKVNIIYTSQLTSAVDLRLFNLTNLKIACFGLQKNGKIKFRIVYDKDGKPKKKTVNIDLRVFKEMIFDHYDTYEPVNPVGLLDLVVDIEKHEPEKLNARIDGIIELLKKHYEISWSSKKNDIEDCLLRIGYPSALASYVYKRLNNRIRPISKDTQNTNIAGNPLLNQLLGINKRQ